GLASVEVLRACRRVPPALLSELATAHNRPRALRNMERFLATMALDHGRLVQLLQRRELFAPLVRLFAGSQMLSVMLMHRPELVLEEGFDLEIAADQTVNDHLSRLRPGDADALRAYQRAQLLVVGFKDLSHQAGPPR